MHKMLLIRYHLRFALAQAAFAVSLGDIGNPAKRDMLAGIITRHARVGLRTHRWERARRAMLSCTIAREGLCMSLLPGNHELFPSVATNPEHAAHVMQSLLAQPE